MKDNYNNNEYNDFFDIMPEDNNNYDFDYFTPDRNSSRKTDIKNGSNGGKPPKKGVKKSPSKFKRTVLSVALIFVITACLIVSAFTVFVVCFVDGSITEDLNSLKLDLNTTVYVKNSKGKWVEHQRLHGNTNRVWVDYENIPDNLKNAFIAIEDQRFMSHNGVDIKRTAAAMANEVLHFYSSKQGGSTITQQLVKNLTGDNLQTPMRKIREIKRSMYLEKNYSKETILECYLNTISMGGNRCGVQVAANYYFGKDVKKLSIAEAAALAAIAKGPEIYRPDLYPEKNTERRMLVLKEMYEQGYITKDEYDKACKKKLKIVADKSIMNESDINSYFVDTIIDDVIDDMVEELGMEKSYAQNNFFNGGYKIYSTMDPKVQKAMEKVYTNTGSYFTQNSRKKKGVKPESAMTVMDYEGHIVGIVGGKGKKTTSRGLNRATSSPRQPGSTMKPLATYAPCIENDIITYSSMLNASKIKNYFGNGKAGPNNVDFSYYGKVTTQFAIEHSVNTAPCQLLKNELGLDKSYDFLTKNLGITTLKESDKNLAALGLGGCAYGITTTESAAAYATFGNLGKYYEPTTYYKVCDSSGKEVLRSDKKGKRAMGADKADVMNHLLQTVVYGSMGTGGRARSYSSMKMYAKTGTTNDTSDLWFVGGTPYYVGSVWYGFDQAEIIYNSSSACTIWRDVMKEVHSGLEYKNFPQSDDVVKRTYCKSTGLLAGSGCGSTATGYYKKDNLPKKCSGRHGGSSKKDDDDKTTSSNKTTSGATTSGTVSAPPETTSREETTSAPTTSTENTTSN